MTFDQKYFFWKNHTQNAMELVIPDQTKLFFNKAACLRPEACNFIKKETLVFSCEFCKIFQNTVFTEQQWAAAFGLVMPCLNSDLYLISKISGTALLETIVCYNPLQSLTGKQKNPSSDIFRHINNITALMCIFSSILNRS